jgi:hypothetical protein
MSKCLAIHAAFMALQVMMRFDAGMRDGVP